MSIVVFKYILTAMCKRSQYAWVPKKIVNEYKRDRTHEPITDSLPGSALPIQIQLAFLAHTQKTTRMEQQQQQLLSIVPLNRCGQHAS